MNRDTHEPGVGAGTTTLVTSRIRGGSLAQLVRHLETVREPTSLSAGGTEAWIQSPAGVLLRFPPACTEPVGADVVEGLLALRGAWLLNYLRAPSEQLPPDSYHFVCSDPGYGYHSLNASARRNVRRGLLRHDVRPCTWQEWAESGYPAYAETERRHGHKPTMTAFRRMVQRWKGQPFHEVWGAWRGGELAAWMSILKLEDWAKIDVVRSRTDAHSDRPTNALLFLVTWTMLVVERRRYVSFGTSPVQEGVNEQSLREFKRRMGYEAVPVRRVFIAQPLLRPVLQSRGAALLWRILARTFPGSELVRKAAGLSRVLSERDPPNP